MNELKTTKNLLSSNLSLLGVLTSLGLLTLTYLILYFLDYFISFEGFLNETAVFGIIYFILLGATYKWLLKENLDERNNFKAGFTLTSIVITIILIIKYLQYLF